MYRPRNSVLFTAIIVTLALCAGCDWSALITVRLEDGGSPPMDAGDDVATTGDTPPTSDEPPPATDVVDTDDAMADAGNSDDAVVTDTNVTTDVTAPDAPSPTDVSTMIDVAPMDVMTDTPPTTDTGPDFPGGSTCAPFGWIRACSATTTCLSVLQRCQTNNTWTPCYVQSNTCLSDAGTPVDSGSTTDAGTPSDVMSLPPDAGPPPGMLCPCSGGWCNLTIRCRTRCGNPGEQLVRQYCAGAFCTAIVPGQC